MADVTPEFEKFAKQALGTDDPARISALKEAVMACMDTDYEEEAEPVAKEGAMDMAAIFGE